MNRERLFERRALEMLAQLKGAQIWHFGSDMKPDDLSQKSREIAKAIADGHSCEQILAHDPTLTYHDIFRAVAEVPTSYWKKDSGCAKPARLPVRHRTD